jgi:hypothetical protein
MGPWSLFSRDRCPCPIILAGKKYPSKNGALPFSASEGLPWKGARTMRLQTRSMVAPLLVALVFAGITATEAAAERTPENFCGTEARDACADLGNPADEAFHNLTGWGEARVNDPVIPPSGDISKRYHTLQADNSLKLFLPRPGRYRLSTEVEDGSCSDDFILLVDGVRLLRYEADANFEGVVRHVVLVPPRLTTDRQLVVTFRNTSEDCGIAAVFNVVAYKARG